jgi:hypothetical protein
MACRVSSEFSVRGSCIDSSVPSSRINKRSSGNLESNKRGCPGYPNHGCSSPTLCGPHAVHMRGAWDGHENCATSHHACPKATATSGSRRRKKRAERITATVPKATPRPPPLRTPFRKVAADLPPGSRVFSLDTWRGKLGKFCWVVLDALGKATSGADPCLGRARRGAFDNAGHSSRNSFNKLAQHCG